VSEKINKILQDLIGLPLTRTTRAANMECLKFGTLLEADKYGKTVNIGNWGLHLQCPWRLTNTKEIIIGSDDLYEQIDENAGYDENFDWDIKGGNLRDVKLKNFISENIMTVKSAIADNFGGLEIVFNDNITLTVFPVVSSKAGYEYWRLLDNKDLSKNHYISTSTGYLPD